jgi:hypothetical protein
MTRLLAVGDKYWDSDPDAGQNDDFGGGRMTIWAEHDAPAGSGRQILGF